MRLQTLAVLCASASFVAVPALAQTSPQTNQQSAAQSDSSMNANHKAGSRSGLGPRQILMHDLQKAGFTNINIEPEAFVVHAMNSQGEPVLMRITPDSMEAVTAMKDAGPNSSNGNGSHPNMSSNNEHGKTVTE